MAVSEAELEAVRAAMRACPPRVPGHHDKVYKDECAFSYDTPLSETGLYINLSTWQACSQAYLALDQQRTGNQLYLNEQWYKVPLSEEESAKADGKPNKLAIGGDGGFQVGGANYEIEKTRSLVVMPQTITIPLPCTQLPELVLDAITGITAHDSAHSAEEVAHWEEDRRPSRYAEGLQQLDKGLGKFGRQIPSDSRQWHCDETGVTENLWLNLSTGFIGSGRQNWDGSGGNGAAMRHYEATGRKYPLVVKLGTITPHGADVFSYAPDEGDMVLDPHLAQHLSHWGINMLGMEKTVKSMAELQIDLNMSFDFDQITESGSKLEPLAGPGLVGLKNLGNSCYMNSVVQVLLSVPAVRVRYVAPAASIFASAPHDPASDFATQMAKLGFALVHGKVAAPPTRVPMGMDGGKLSVNGICDGDDSGMSVAPTAFKLIVGRGHPEFSSARQQDAMEYFQHLLELMTRCERSAAGRLGAPGAPPTADAFRFEVEDRIQCVESQRVSYKRSSSNVLSLPIPLDAATNKEELEQFQERQAKRTKLREAGADAGEAPVPVQPEDGRGPQTGRGPHEASVLPRVPLAACLEAWAAPEQVDGYLSAALGRRGRAIKRAAVATFPPFLLLQLRRYYVGENWTPKKLEVLVDVPEVLNLTHLRAAGPQPDEQLQPDNGAAAAAVTTLQQSPATPQPDPDIVASLTAMGFSTNGSKRAALATQNAGTEASMEWVLEHMEDPDFNDPLPAHAPPPGPAAAPPAAAPDPENLAMLAGMGFTPQQAGAALAACGGSLERAGDWLFSHADDLDAAVAAAATSAAPGPTSQLTASAGGPRPFDDGCGMYELVGFISHVGSNTACGHYVCHLKKNSRWVIFNDEKVAVSEHPPKDLGYLYLFRRQDAA